MSTFSDDRSSTTSNFGVSKWTPVDCSILRSTGGSNTFRILECSGSFTTCQMPCFDIQLYLSIQQQICSLRPSSSSSKLMVWRDETEQGRAVRQDALDPVYQIYFHDLRLSLCLNSYFNAVHHVFTVFPKCVNFVCVVLRSMSTFSRCFLFKKYFGVFGEIVFLVFASKICQTEVRCILCVNSGVLGV